MRSQPKALQGDLRRHPSSCRSVWNAQRVCRTKIFVKKHCGWLEGKSGHGYRPSSCSGDEIWFGRGKVVRDAKGQVLSSTLHSLDCGQEEMVIPQAHLVVEDDGFSQDLALRRGRRDAESSTSLMKDRIEEIEFFGQENALVCKNVHYAPDAPRR